MRIILSIVFVLSAIAGGHTQDYTTYKTTSSKARKFYERGLQFARQGTYYKALSNLQNALKADPELIDARIQLAAIQYDMGNLENAAKGFDYVLKLAPGYDVDVYYMAGLTRWKLDDFEKAAQHFTAFLRAGPRHERSKRKAETYLANSLFAAQAIKNPVPFRPRRLSDSINSPHSEYLPALTADGSTLIFTRRTTSGEDFYISKKTNGEWGKAYPMTSINTANNEGAQSISADGRFFVFTACNRPEGYGSCDIYYSKRAGDQWTPPRNIGSPINTRGWESQPALSADGKTLYFAAERPGGLGGRDIWMSQQQQDGSWSQPENLGASINTSNHDQSPFIHPDDQTLYFMSKGYPGMGNYDLYFSRRQPDGTWGKPKNMGYPINTKGNEGAIFISLDGMTAYFASDKNLTDTMQKGDITTTVFEDAKSNITTDIYSFELYEAARPKPVTYVKAKVMDADTKWPLVAEVEFIELLSGTVRFEDQTGTDGAFLTCLPAGKNYALNVSKEGYLFHSENFSLESINTFTEPFILEIYLEKIQSPAESGEATSKPVILKNVFFETASAALRPESIVELNRLKRLLQENPTLKIRIQGHTDKIGSEQDNQVLSLNRAKAVYNYLVKNGIDQRRLSYKGFGETQPIATNETAEGRQKNRRTEFVVVY